MFRTTTARAVLETFTGLRWQVARGPLYKYTQQAAYRSSTRQIKTSPLLALTVQQPLQKSLIRYASSSGAASADHTITLPGGQKIVWGEDAAVEQKSGEEKVMSLPALVSMQSSVHNINSETGVANKEDDVDMMAGINSDFVGEITSVHDIID